MNLSANDFDVPDDAIRFNIASELDAHHVMGSLHAEEEQARTRLASLVSPSLYKVLMASLDPNNQMAVQVNGGETARLYTTLVKIRNADRAAGLLEVSKEAATRNSLIAYVALVDPATLDGLRSRVVRDERMTPSSLILLPRNTASPEDVAAGIVAMSRLRRLYGDEVIERVEMNVVEFRAVLSPAQTGRAKQILKAAMMGPTHSVPGFGDASMTSVRLSPLQP